MSREELGTVRLGAALMAVYLVLLSMPLRLESVGPAVTAGLIGLYAFDPSVYDGLTGDFDVDDPRHGVALIGVIFASWLVVLQPLVMMVRVFVLGVQSSTMLGLGDIFAALLLNVLVLVGVPVVWALFVNSDKPLSESLRFDVRRPAIDVGWGVVIAFVSLLVVAGVNYVLVTYGGMSPTNPLAERIIELSDLRTGLLISLMAAVGEETFFRGFLQTRIGIVPAAVLFSIGHSSYGVATQIIGPLIFGLLLGWLLEYRDSIVGPVVAHFLFNFSVFYAALRLGVGG